MKLYYYPLSTYSQKVLIALHEKQLEFESELVSLFDPEAARHYREIYPLGKIPLLVNEEDMVPESSIIVEYLDRIGGAQLIPSDPVKSRRVRFKDRMYDLYLNDAITTLIFQGWKAEDQRDPSRIEQAKERINVMYEFMEQEFAEQPFSNGGQFTLSDCAAAAALFYAPRFAPFTDYPNIVRYWDRLLARDSIQRVHAEAEPYVKKMREKDDAA